MDEHVDSKQMRDRALWVEQPIQRPEQSGLVRGEGSCQEVGTLNGPAMYFYCFENLKKEALLAPEDDLQLPPLKENWKIVLPPQNNFPNKSPRNTISMFC